MTERKVIILIPARMHSSRFPGKPLYKIGGHPLICWTYTQAKQTGYCAFVITPDSEIYKEVMMQRHIPCITTSDVPTNGTERCAEVIRTDIFSYLKDDDIIVNIQGDNMVFDVMAVKELVKLMKTGKVEYGTLFANLYASACMDRNRVKCTIMQDDQKGIIQVNCFDREVISSVSSNFLHVGVYAYTKKALLEYANYPIAEREFVLQLEQLRIHGNGKQIGAVLSDVPTVIDCLEDAVLAERQLIKNELKHIIV